MEWKNEFMISTLVDININNMNIIHWKFKYELYELIFMMIAIIIQCKNNLLQIERKTPEISYQYVSLAESFSSHIRPKL